jgi:hypothetical protein
MQHYELTITYHTGAREQHAITAADRDAWPTAWLRDMARDAANYAEPLEATITIGLMRYELKSVELAEVALGGPASYPVAIPYTITRTDVAGVEHHITLLGGGYYQIDGAGSTSGAVGHGDGTISLYHCPASEAPHRITFANGEPWDDENLGYENLWMLTGYYPHDRTQGLSGYPCRGEAGRRWQER